MMSNRQRRPAELSMGAPLLQKPFSVAQLKQALEETTAARPES